MRSNMRKRVGTAGALALALAGLAGCQSGLSPSQQVFFTVDDVVIGNGATAVPGDLVTIRYVAWLWEEDPIDHKGQQVDSGEFEFLLGVGETLSAFEQGLGNMRVGGLRRMQVPPEYALGGEGLGNIPANSTLVIEVELLAVRPLVTDSAPFQIIDLREGDGDAAGNGFVLTVAYVGHLYDESQPDNKGRQFEVNNSFNFSLGLGRVIEGWDEGLVGMRENGERRLIIPPELAYGETGQRPRIPPDATLLFDITLISVQVP
jgi:FKBP-type peptidyl-prolyl cis-trans isomerase